MSDPAAPTLAASGAYSPPNTVPVLVSGVDTNRNVTYFAFNVFNTSTKTFSMVNITSGNDNVTSLSPGQYLIYVSTGAAVSPATVLVLTLKIAYTDNSVTPNSQELSTLSSPETPQLLEACIRLDSDSGYVSLIQPSNITYWSGANAGIVYYTEYVDESGETQVESNFTTVDDSETLDIEGTTYMIFPVILAPAETGYIAVQYQYFFRGQTYVGPMSDTTSYTDAETPLPPLTVSSSVNDLPITGASTPYLQELSASVTWLPPILSQFIDIQQYTIYRDDELIATVAGDVTSYVDMTVAYGATYVYGVRSNSANGESAMTVAPSLDMPSVIPATSAVAAIATPDGVYPRVSVLISYDVANSSNKYMLGADVTLNGLDGYSATTRVLRSNASVASQTAYLDVIGNETLVATVVLFARNGDGVEYYSSDIYSNSVSTGVEPPSTVSVTQLAVDQSAPSVIVQWSYSTETVPLEAFILEYMDNSGQIQRSEPIPPTIFEYTIVNMAVDRTYTYRVIAVATGGIESDPSAPVSIDIDPPFQVGNLAAEYTVPIDDLLLTWSDASNYGMVPPEFYAITISSTSGILYTNSIPGSQNSYQIDGAGFLPGVTYDIKVESIPYLVEQAPESFQPDFNTVELTIAMPGAVENLTNSYTVSSDTLVLNWNRASNYDTFPPQYYDIDIVNIDGETSVYLERVSGAATTATIVGAGLLPGKTYDIIVYSMPYLVNNDTATPNSNSTELVVELPDAVQNLTNDYSIVTDSVELTWNYGANYGSFPPQYYDIDIYNDGTMVNTRRIAGSETDITIAGTSILFPGETYVINVVSIPYLADQDPGSFTPLFASTEFTTPGLPSVPSVTATPYIDYAPQTIDIAWEDPADSNLITSYLVYRQIDGGPYVLWTSVPKGSSPYMVTDNISAQDMGQTYVYKVVSVDQYGTQSSGTISNSNGPLYYPASPPISLSIMAYSLVVNATFSNPIELNGGTGVDFTVQLIDTNDVESVVATKTVAYSAPTANYFVSFLGTDGVQVGHTYIVVAWLNTSYEGHSIVGNSATSNQDTTGSVPIITDMNIDESGVVSITYVSNVLQPSNSQPYTPFSAEELLYPIPVLVGSADPVTTPTRPLVNILPSDTQIVDGLTVLHTATIANVGNEYTLTYVPKLFTDPSVDVAASFAAFVVSNRYGTQTQLHPMDIVLSSTSQPV